MIALNPKRTKDPVSLTQKSYTLLQLFTVQDHFYQSSVLSRTCRAKNFASRFDRKNNQKLTENWETSFH